MTEVLNRLDHQDKTLEQMMILIKGSHNYNTEGLLPAVKRIEKDVHEIKEWKNQTIQMKGKIDMKAFVTNLGFVGRGLIWFGGIGGGTYGIFELLKFVFDK